MAAGMASVVSHSPPTQFMSRIGDGTQYVVYQHDLSGLEVKTFGTTTPTLVKKEQFPSDTQARAPATEGEAPHPSPASTSRQSQNRTPTLYVPSDLKTTWEKPQPRPLQRQ
ncbi:hypothetical protein EYF80_040130 [Liparis tanakae]|uniref:Uncharacterized protein n=1 Tax=Liparis tanakae TaxID=230148 RepID=A0A4Z2G930_9TELE|nr:hypothetical protein EYF80_040130 [Liparis tanakae]